MWGRAQPTPGARQAGLLEPTGGLTAGGSRCYPYATYFYAIYRSDNPMKLIEQRSGGAITFSAAALYPLLYRLEKRGWIQGRWVERAGQRRRRFYALTSSGRRILDEQRTTWRAFAAAIDRIAGTGEA